MSFKSGSHDLRESPTLQLIKRLIGDGYCIQIYDRSVSRSLIYGANRIFAENEVPHIFSLIRPTIEEVVQGSEVVVICNNDAEFSSVCKLTAAQQIVDLVGVHRPSNAPPVLPHHPSDLEQSLPIQQRLA
jgi:GDP-mannose 6-dehydrogenase